MRPAAASTDKLPYSHASRDTQDADDHAACLSNWQQRYDQLSAGSFSGVFEEFCFDNVQLFREGMNQSVHQTGGAWPGSRTFAVPIAIEGTGRFGGEVYGAQSMLTLGGTDELDFRTPRKLEILACTANAKALGDYAQQLDHRNLEAELAGRRMAPATPDRILALGSLLATMMTSLRATPELLQHAQMRKAMEQALFATLLDTLSSDTSGRHTSAPSCHARQLVVARARAYMEAHIDEPITVADLCIELGVSRRTLQYSFQDVLDLNPVKFLRAIRLNAVRRALKAAPNGGTTVADVAARWGFWHLSHFSAQYKTMFGELPSETLRRTG